MPFLSSGGSSGRFERNSTPVCCWVRPVHSETSTGSDTVGKPTSMSSVVPVLHSAVQRGSVLAICFVRPSINTTRVCVARASGGPLPPGSGAGSVGSASYVVIARMTTRRRSGTIQAIAPRIAMTTIVAIQ